MVLAFLQSPGLTVADTKLDLSQNPWGFLSQALSPWTDVFPLGQLQNQAYGYLFPHGLFFAVFSWLPAWVSQRLWWALLLFLAFAGVVRLLESLRIGHPFARVVAGVLYALSPRIITTLGAISSEAWVVALAPWVLLPLVSALAGPGAEGWGAGEATRELTAEQKKHLRRAALRSAVAVLCMGAVNAVATAVAVLPAVIFWCLALLRPATRRRAVYLGFWWVPAGIAACFWWIGPLLILGRYSPAFTDFIEASSLTTRWLGLVETLRGTTSWVPFLSEERIAGAALVSEVIFILATLAVALLGLWGLSRRDLPLAGVWLTILAFGLLAMGLAMSPFSPVSEPVRSFLDATGAALRNVHKFDPLVRLPLVIGVAHILGRIQLPSLSKGGREQWLRPEKYPGAPQTIGALLLVAIVVAPAWSGRLAPADGFREVPEYWHSAASWLNEHVDPQTDGRVMLLPEARFARQTWGNTRDEPAQPLLDVPWVVRDSVPLVQPDAIRGLDGLQREINRGLEAPGLADGLLNQGVGYVLVRSDLTKAADTPGAGPVLRTLRRSGGFKEVAAFGDAKAPEVQIFEVSPERTGAGSGDDVAAADSGAGAGANTGAGAGADVAPNPAGGLREVPLEDVEVVHAGPEALPRLEASDRELGRTQPPRVRVLAQQLGQGSAHTWTDTPARRDHHYGNVVDADSEIRAEGDSTRVLNPVRDYPLTSVVPGVDPAASPQTEIKTSRGKVRASSSAADPTGFGGADTRRSITAAVDGDPETAWYPTPGRSVGQYLEFELEDSYRNLGIRLLTQGSTARIHVESFRDEEGASTEDAAPLGSTTVTASPGSPVNISVPGGEANRVRLQILGAFTDVGFAEVEITGTDAAGKTIDLTPQRVPTVPAPPANAPGSGEEGADGAVAGAEDGNGAHLQRFLFGQEIPEHKMLREFTVPPQLDGAEFLLHTDSCHARPEVFLDGKPYRCGDRMRLSSGRHRLDTQARWASLSIAELDYVRQVAHTPGATPVPAVSDGYSPTGEESYRVESSERERLVFLPSTANPGRVARVHEEGQKASEGLELEPVTVNGWQQGWVLPAGVSGVISVEFEATGVYQTWLLIGLLLAVGLCAAWIWSEYRVPRGRRGGGDAASAAASTAEHDAGAAAATEHSIDVDTSSRGTRVLAGSLATALAVGLAGLPGLIVAAVYALLAFALPRWAEKLEAQHPGQIWPTIARRLWVWVAGVAALIATTLAAQWPWTKSTYAGDSWVVQLCLLVVLLSVYFAHARLIPRRAGSSTQE